MYAIKAAAEKANITPAMSVSEIGSAMEQAMTEIRTGGDRNDYLERGRRAVKGTESRYYPERCISNLLNRYILPPCRLTSLDMLFIIFDISVWYVVWEGKKL
ncbi:hypothetical protein [Stomatobaculum longum]|uniref:hypothetical protein n=1 Tax=Stomatobaculum longum TaxID=796942 RepID=UPI002ED1274E